jgi:phytoene dehydrogenase-like protein
MPAGRTQAQIRAKLSKALTKHLVDDFAEHGADVVAKLRVDKPNEYLKMVSAVLEREDAAEAAAAVAYNVVERRVLRPVNQDGGPTIWRADPEFK